MALGVRFRADYSLLSLSHRASRGSDARRDRAASLRGVVCGASSKGLWLMTFVLLFFPLQIDVGVLGLSDGPGRRRGSGDRLVSALLEHVLALHGFSGWHFVCGCGGVA